MATPDTAQRAWCGGNCNSDPARCPPMPAWVINAWAETATHHLAQEFRGGWYTLGGMRTRALALSIAALATIGIGLAGCSSSEVGNAAGSSAVQGPRHQSRFQAPQRESMPPGSPRSWPAPA